MAKQEFIKAQRLKPLGADGLEAIKQIVETKTAAKVNEVFVDLFSASIIKQVFDVLAPSLREKLLAKPVAQAADICFKVATKTGFA